MAKSSLESTTEAIVNLTGKIVVRVLYVDDDSSFLKIAKSRLEAKGQFDVDAALSVEEATRKMRERTYDVVVSDYQMPERNGLEFLRDLRQRGDRVPFIMFTGKGSEEVAIGALNSGADQYLNKTGDPEKVYAELADHISKVVERKRVEDHVAYQAQLMQNVNDAIIATDENFVITSWNHAAEEMYGWKAVEVIGRHGEEAIPTGFVGVDRSEAVRAFEETGKFRGEVIQHCRNGKTLYVEITAMPLKGKNGTLAGYVCVNRDITERRKSEELYRSLMEMAPDCIVHVNLEGVVTACNDVVATYLGCPKEEIVGKHFSKLESLRSDDIPKYLKLYNEIVMGKVPRPFEVTWHRKDGTRQCAEVCISLIKECGKTKGIQAIARDTTERKHEEIRSLAQFPAENPNPILRVSRDGVILYANEASNTLLQVLQCKVGGRVPQIWSEKVAETLRTGLERNVDADVGERFYTFFVTPVSNADYVNVYGSDITERRRREKQLADSEAKFRSIAERSFDAIITVNLEGQVTYASPSAEKILGYPLEELVGKQFYRYFGGKELSTAAQAFADLGKGKSIENLQIEAIKKDGSRALVEVNASPIVSNGKVVGIEAIARNITERKLMEEKLAESEQRLRQLVENAPDAIYTNDVDGVFTDGNRQAEILTGYKKEELVGKNLKDLGLISEESLPKAVEMLQKNAAGQTAGPEEIALIRKDGSKVFAEVSSMAVRRSGKTETLGIARDITERKKMEAALQKSEEMFRAISDSANDGIVLIDGAARISYWNAAAERVFGYSKEEAVGKEMYELIVPERSRKRTAEGIRRFIETGQASIVGRNVGMIALRKDGTEFPLEINISVLQLGGKWYAMSIARDVTERKRSEQAIQESQEKFERLFMSNPEAAAYLDSDFNILDINPRFTELFDYSLDEVIRKNINEAVVPKDKLEEARELEEKAKSEHVYHDTLRKRKDGSLVPVAVSAAPIDVGGRLLGYVVVYKDISELKRTERKLETSNEKLRVVGSLTRHDVRNKLAAITGNAYLAKKKLAGNEEVLGYLEDMENAVHQSVRIFEFAKTYELLGVEELKYVDIDKTINEAISLFSDFHGVKVINECQGLMVLADSLLRQLFYNLVDNSLKYGQKISQIRIRFENLNDEQLKLIYEDDGVGIAVDEKPKLFREGYGRGTGYGLYLIKKMVEVYGWTIEETGEPGKGVQFTMTMPQRHENKDSFQIKKRS